MLRVNQMKLHDKIKIIVGFFPVKTNVVLRTSSWKMHAAQMLVFFSFTILKILESEKAVGREGGIENLNGVVEYHTQRTKFMVLDTTAQ